jgi:hypothetical protein
MALLRTLWMNRIMENLYADNSFMDKSLNWDEYVNAGAKTVVIPQAALLTGVVRNRTSFPASATQSNDTDIEYTMTNYTTDPLHVTNLEQIQMSYDKMMSKIKNMTANLKEQVALDTLYAWRPETGYIIATTGDTVDTGLVGSTGTRKALTFADVVKAGKMMNKMNIPKSGRILLVTSDMHADLLLDPTIKDKFNTSLANLNTGVLGSLAGFMVMERSSTLACSSTNAVKLPSAAVVATDSELAIAYHPDFIGKSIGNMQIYFNADDALYYGGVISMEMNAGGKKAYTDGKGVVGIRPANVA